MIKYINTVLKSTNPNFFHHKLLFIAIIVLIIYYLYKLSTPISAEKKEGFSQESPFVLKTDLDIYDDFYASVYDGITDRNKMCQRELFEIIKMTQPDTTNSTILDVGSGTGCAVSELVDAGYQAYGIDKSSAMIDLAEAKYPDIQFIKGDIMDSMAFEKGLFTHILCTNFTIYEISNKSAFFKNCYHWLKPNSYLVLHLIDKEKFSARTFKDSIMDFPALYRLIQPQSKERKTSTSAEFIDYIYDANYEIKHEIIIFKETFTDKTTRNIRQNENTLFIEPIEKILNMASSIGFIIHAKTAMSSCGGDENQFIYVLERAM
jgi:ubiquinone/menaquinone biosynthesis C-methylase UbiE